MSPNEDPRPDETDGPEVPAGDDDVAEFVREVEEDPASNPPQELDDIRGG